MQTAIGVCSALVVAYVAIDEITSPSTLRGTKVNITCGHVNNTWTSPNSHVVKIKYVSAGDGPGCKLNSAGDTYLFNMGKQPEDFSIAIKEFLTSIPIRTKAVHLPLQSSMLEHAINEIGLLSGIQASEVYIHLVDAQDAPTHDPTPKKIPLDDIFPWKSEPKCTLPTSNNKASREVGFSVIQYVPPIPYDVSLVILPQVARVETISVKFDQARTTNDELKKRYPFNNTEYTVLHKYKQHIQVDGDTATIPMFVDTTIILQLLCDNYIQKLKFKYLIEESQRKPDKIYPKHESGTDYKVIRNLFSDVIAIKMKNDDLHMGQYENTKMYFKTLRGKQLHNEYVKFISDTVQQLGTRGYNITVDFPDSQVGFTPRETSILERHTHVSRDSLPLLIDDLPEEANLLLSELDREKLKRILILWCDLIECLGGQNTYQILMYGQVSGKLQLLQSTLKSMSSQVVKTFQKHNFLRKADRAATISDCENQCPVLKNLPKR